jgi:hypothetical protein
VIGKAPGLAVMVGQFKGGLVLYGLMMYVILPGANPLMVDATPRGPFIIGHVTGSPSG